MKLKNIALALLSCVALTLAGCGDDGGGDGDMSTTEDMSTGDPQPIEGCDGECAFIVNRLVIPSAATGSVVGFNLDGKVSNNDTAACDDVADFTAPNGTAGVDNSFAALADGLGGLGGDIDIQASIDAALGPQDDGTGPLGLVFAFSGVDGTFDSDVSISVYLLDDTATADFTFDGNRIAAGQMAALGTPIATLTGAIDGSGKITAEAASLALQLAVAGEDLTLTLYDARFEGTLDANLTDATLGGGVAVDELVTQICNIEAAAAYCEQVMGILPGFADLEPSTDGQTCARLSLGIGPEFTTFVAQ